MARVHSFTVATITGHAAPSDPPADWADLLGWWDGQRLASREVLIRPATTPVKSPFPRGEFTVGGWIRRLAHEFAIHRLDAESALPRDPSTWFSREFATDGVDEYLTFLTPSRAAVSPFDGVVRVATTDSERTWFVHLVTGQTPGTAAEAEPDVTLEGAADDVYRALWGRPHGAAVTGSSGLLAALAAP